ncbi:MAG: DMT family transporter [Pseudomonadota bacterium]
MAEPNLKTGLLAAAAILVIWSGFIVFSRAGVLSGLTPYDVAALRFLVAGTLTVPFAYAWWPRHLSLRVQVLIALAGPGAIYSVMLFKGLENASAAYGGIFANGALPLFTMLIALIVTGIRPTAIQLLGAMVIVLGGVMVAWRGLTAGGADVMLGIGLFVGASSLIATYIYMLKHCNVTPKQALALVNIPNALLYLPVWLLFLPSALAEVPIETVLAQAAFQGLGPGFLAVMIFALMAFHLGATPTAAVSATVPAAAALLAVPVLGEIPTPLEWTGIAVVSIGLWVMIRSR